MMLSSGVTNARNHEMGCRLRPCTGQPDQPLAGHDRRMTAAARAGMQTDYASFAHTLRHELGTAIRIALRRGMVDGTRAIEPLEFATVLTRASCGAAPALLEPFMTRNWSSPSSSGPSIESHVIPAFLPLVTWYGGRLAAR